MQLDAPTSGFEQELRFWAKRTQSAKGRLGEIRHRQLASGSSADVLPSVAHAVAAAAAAEAAFAAVTEQRQRFGESQLYEA